MARDRVGVKKIELPRADVDDLIIELSALLDLMLVEGTELSDDTKIWVRQTILKLVALLKVNEDPNIKE
ncbi:MULTISPECIES: hypothetical protein [Grimontia]|uniref:Uncharacterized protein n=1 Tax=Grimontia marina TaxID=646534 RepID=A0A128F018_9GAMM|nr:MULTISPECIES: hypothetical protein [Grimontia]WRV98855.1 hypothetical protein VP504_05380 [Grimontia sp. NTOU-MAR1]CZF79754.1 hypothetical protein GMA8713_01117 [Grimontia marina]